MKDKLPSFEEFRKVYEYKEEETKHEYPSHFTEEDIEFCEKAKRGEIVFKKYDDPHQPIVYI